ncbi:MAG: type I pullulanase [Ruminococcus sp.]|nr:type I pullulanase [Ruminococcus sp.]
MFKKLLCAGLSCALIASSAVFANAYDSSKTQTGASNQYTNASQNLDSRQGYDGKDLGATYSKSGTTFKVWAPTAKEVKVNLYSSGTGGSQLSSQNMTYNSSNGVWSTTISGDQKNKFYTYTVNAANVLGQNQQSRETQDIYSVATGINGKRSQIVNLDDTDPADWDKDVHIAPAKNTDSYVWEVHVKDFSWDTKSGVSSKNRGKFLAFTETGTTLNKQGKYSTMLDYVKKLGVTTVQITPFYDFGSIDEGGSNDQFNWGYDPVNYNVPEGSYSSNPNDGNVRIKECKQMIQALHKAGLSVVMDVVYNHTYSAPDSSFEKCVPNYYYRMQANGKYSDGSGCGNETASERRMYRNFLIQSCMYWVNEYHIDGFRFDLMGVHDCETMNLLRKEMDKVDKRLVIWGEGWTGGSCTYPDKTWTGQQFHEADRFNSGNLDERVAIFNDGIRDAIKGSVFELKGKGWVQGNASSMKELNEGIMGNTVGTHDAKTYQWVSKAPSQTVSYTSCHDNQTLWDRLAASQGVSDFRGRNDKLAAQNKLAGGLLNMSQGITFMLAGEEMGRSKDNDENSYKSPAGRNMIDWGNVQKNSDIVDFYRGTRQIREKFSPLRDDTKGSISGYKSYSGESASTTYAAVWHNNKQGEWKKLAVIANSAANQIDYQIDGSEGNNWVILANSKGAGVKKLGEVSNGKFTLPGYSMVIAVDKDSFENVNTQPTTEAPATEPPTEAPTTTAPVTTTAPETTTAPVTTLPQYELGDVNRDKKLNIKDATEIQKKLALLTEFDAEQMALADFNKDGAVSIKDATAIQMRLAKLS